MTDANAVYRWHNDYRGQSRDQVRSTLTDDLERDQRAYEAALDGSEADEFGAHTLIRDLDRRWDRYHFSWQETDASALAAQIESHAWASDEAERDIPWSEFRSAHDPVVQRSAGTGLADQPTPDRRPTAYVWYVVVAVIAILVMYFAFR